jgi:hypothetical protein
MDGIGMHGDIHNVELAATHVLFAKRSFLGGPLERRVDVFLDFVEVLDTDGLIADKVRTVGLRTEAPDLEGVVFVPVELFGPDLGTFLRISLSTVLLGGFFDLVAKLAIQRFGSEVQTIVLVRGLGETSLA